tara:strand:- start:60 stop:482 length:423 start_codon:yes stop_codon:yes gene_type:complete
MPYKDPEARKEYRLKNKEKQKEYDRQYRLNNKERKKERDRQWGLNNKEKIKEYQKKYRQTEQGIKTNRIKNWKRQGIITDDYEALYDHYLKTSFCDECKIELSYDKHITKTTKCCDHDHTITDRPNFRNILCHPCNTKRR